MSAIPRPLSRLLAVAACCVIAAALTVIFSNSSVAGGAAKISRLAYKSKTANLPPDNSVHSATARCPRGLHVLGGGIKLSDPVSDFVQGSFPKRGRLWVAQGFRSGGNVGTEKVTSYAICGR